MKILTLSLKKQWFDLIKSGIKKEEYRDGNEYWEKRLIYNKLTDGPENAQFKHYDKLVFTLGYPKSDDTTRRLEFKNPKIRIGEGRPEWGAEPGKKYFVITWEV